MQSCRQTFTERHKQTSSLHWRVGSYGFKASLSKTAHPTFNALKWNTLHFEMNKRQLSLAECVEIVWHCCGCAWLDCGWCWGGLLARGGNGLSPPSHCGTTDLLTLLFCQAPSTSISMSLCQGSNSQGLLLDLIFIEAANREITKVSKSKKISMIPVNAAEPHLL